jgi:Tetratricopeptide repeat
VTADRLPALVEAFRNETAHRQRDDEILRARVLRKFVVRRRQARPFLWLIPLFAVLIGTGALAATSGHVPLRFARLLALLSPRLSVPSEPRRTRDARALPEVSMHPVGRSPGPSAAPELAVRGVLALEEIPVDVSRPAGAARARGVEWPAPRAPVVRRRDISEELAMYRVAHTLYFGGGSPSQALEAFQAYLLAFPDGVLSVEARFNEGACLARLGRKQEAMQRLEPFANGTHGGYLQKNARDLERTIREP